MSLSSLVNPQTWSLNWIPESGSLSGLGGRLRIIGITKVKRFGVTAQSPPAKSSSQYQGDEVPRMRQ